MKKREVWSSHEVTIALYEEIGNGSYNPVPTRQCDFAQRCNFKEVIEVKEDGVPGKAVKDINTFPNGFEIRIGEFYCRKSEQLTPFTDRTKKYRIAILAANESYTGQYPYEHDSHVFRDASCVDWNVEWEDNGVLAISLAFKAETME